MTDNTFIRKKATNISEPSLHQSIKNIQNPSSHLQHPRSTKEATNTSKRNNYQSVIRLSKNKDMKKRRKKQTDEAEICFMKTSASEMWLCRLRWRHEPADAIRRPTLGVFTLVTELHL